MVDGVVEVDPARAKAALNLKKQSLARGCYEGTKVFGGVEEFGEKVKNGEIVEPKCVNILTVSLRSMWLRLRFDNSSLPFFSF